MKKYAGEEFLNKIYKDLVNDEIVKRTGQGGNKNKDVHTYLERLKKIVGNSLEHNKISLLKKLCYNKYIIKPKNVKESYFKQREQIALDRGLGHLKYTDNMKKQKIEQIINEQKLSLDSWIEYFVSKNTEMYPAWFKFFCFNGMTRLGHFDKKENKYTKRTETTVKPFIEINREALAMVYDELIKVLNEEDIDDKKLEALIKNGSFSKIYAYCIRKLEKAKKNNENNYEGIWKKYIQGSNPKILFDDIHGKGTGWCTAGGLETAAMHLEDGDFYVYFTKDENKEYTCPRIAIRMEDDEITEIRGIAENQNLEPNMEKIVEKKLDEFPDKEKYKKKVRDMKILTYIYNECKNNKNVELSKEQLCFLYEIKEDIIGFGYEEDPRIREIIKNRDIINDYNKIFKDINEFSGKIKHLKRITSAKGLKLPKIVNRTLNLNRLTSAEDLVLPEIINGELKLNGLTSAKDLNLPDKLNGSLYLDGLKSAEDLVLPDTINGSLSLDGLTSAKDLNLPKKLKGSLTLNSLKSAEDLKLPTTLNVSLYLRGLTSAKGLVLPDTLNGDLYLSSLQSAEGLILSNTINGSINLSSLTNAEGLVLPDTLNGDLHLENLKSAENLKLPKMINGSLYLNSLINANGLRLPDTLNGVLYLNSLTSAEDLNLTEGTNKSLRLDGLRSAEGLNLPDTLNGFLNLNGLISAKGLNLPDTLNGDLYLESLINAEDLILPKNLKGSIHLEGLKNADGLNLPNDLNGSLYLDSLTSTEGLILPENIRGSLILSSLTSTEELKLPQIISLYLFLNKLNTTKGLIIPDELNCKLQCPLANNDINMLKQMCKENNKTKSLE